MSMSAQTQRKTSSIGEHVAKVLLVTMFAYILIRACIEFYLISWGTGLWLGEFSLKWGLGFLGFVLVCLFTFAGIAISLWKPSLFGTFPRRILVFRKGLGSLRWVIAIVLLALPVWFLQFTPWGVVFRGLYFRLMLWGYVVLVLTVFIERSEKLVRWSSLLAALLLTSTVFSVAFAFINVSAYPFSIGWSEGNRMWDYSLLFGRGLYDYPVDERIYSPTDVGRQLVGGLPFIFPGMTIVAERLWVGATTVIPYVLLGFAAFRSDIKNKKLWVLLACFAFIFLKQGPIHPPLVLSAFVVVLLWHRPLWLAIPLVFVTGYLTELSRFTWLFAPAIWIVMLEFSGALLKKGHLQKATWWRTAALGISGAAGGYFGGTLVNWLKALFVPGETAALTNVGAVSVSSLSSSVSVHPLFWYRLLPNATYGQGILLALLIAVLPTITLLVYLSAPKKWVLNHWQKAALVLPLLAFLVVGLIVSTKAGGGGDLHNLDMFLIGIFFTAVLAWENGGRQWLGKIETSPVWVKGMLVLLLVIPGIKPLSALRSFQFAQDLPWLVTLTDVSDAKFLEMLPPQDEVDKILQTLRRNVEIKKSQGEVLFMDQRQLLTFGYIETVPLVPEYEKKVLMNEAMGANAGYFAPFYADLEARRFSLIISEPLRAPVKDSSYQFGEENNAWVEWVVEPVLCYYEEIETFRSVQIQLLVPKQGDVDCSSRLPVAPATQE
jgi:hypothetical protein